MNFGRVAVALDTARDRVFVQGSLPKWIVNAWTQAGDVGVSRHDFIGEEACLACLYIPEGQSKNDDEIIADALGIPDMTAEKVRPLLHSGDPVGKELIELIAKRLGAPINLVMKFEGQPLRTFYSDVICGGGVLNFTNRGRTVQAEVPMAFQSAFAGLMLAAELVKHAADQMPEGMTTTKFNLMRPLPKLPTSERRRKDRLGRCICQDPDYIHVYKEKYSPATA